MEAACRAGGVQLMDGTMWVHSERTPFLLAAIRDKGTMGSITDVTSTFTFAGEPLPNMSPDSEHCADELRVSRRDPHDASFQTTHRG